MTPFLLGAWTSVFATSCLVDAWVRSLFSPPAPHDPEVAAEYDDLWERYAE